MIKINGAFHFDERLPHQLSFLLSDPIQLKPIQNTWGWYAFEREGGGMQHTADGGALFLNEGCIVHFTDTGCVRQPVPFAEAHELEYAQGHVIGVIDDDNYAFYDLEKKAMLFEGSDDDGVDELCFYSPEVHIYKEYKRLVARDNNGGLLWETKIRTPNNGGTVHKYISNSEQTLFFFEVGYISHDVFMALSPVTGEIVAEYTITKGVSIGSLICENNHIYFADLTYMWVLDGITAQCLNKVELPIIPDRRATAFTQSTIALMHHAGELVILDKSTLNHLHTLDLGQGQYVCAMTGNKTGVAVRLVDKNAYRFNAAGYGLYLTDAQLLAGEMPDLTPEPLAATIEQQPAEGGYNLLVTINAGLTVADFLRHTSHALWQTPYQHASIRSTIDRSETRQGNPDFKGILTLNLTHAPTLTREQDQAVTAIVNGAKNILDECVVDLGGENERAVDIVVAR
ncbi:hypothetical protein [Marinagarivorans algicola]|uniref:hypothetical protein n=1 Tax=Marinagarivorans algicola TaxID=1513270 RepID=UPI0037360E71